MFSVLHTRIAWVPPIPRPVNAMRTMFGLALRVLLELVLLHAGPNPYDGRRACCIHRECSLIRIVP